MENKQALRQKFKDIRKSLDMKEKSRILCHSLKELNEYKTAKNVLIFYPLENEVDLRSLLTDDKNFYLPRVCGKNLEVCPYKEGEKLETSRFKVCEPCTEPIDPKELDLVIVPALTVDKENYRLGYGGGFYDRFLAQYPSVTTITLIPQELLAEKLPKDEFDRKIDRIVIG